MNILALIPARGGSKRLHKKNIKVLGGKPLINWSIDVARNITEVSDVLVSTDDAEIAEISGAAGALVPWLRPAVLSSDTATSVDVALHSLDWYERNVRSVDGLLLLQPTSPFRSEQTMKEGISQFIRNKNKTIIGVSKTHSHPMWTMKIDNNGCLKPFLDGDGLGKRSQELPAAYVINGSFYLISPDNLRREKSFFNPNESLPLVSKGPYESLDIDTQIDFEIAEYFASKILKV